MTLGFLLTTLIIVASPGTGVIYTLSACGGHARSGNIAAACDDLDATQLRRGIWGLGG